MLAGRAAVGRVEAGHAAAGYGYDSCLGGFGSSSGSGCGDEGCGCDREGCDREGCGREDYDYHGGEVAMGGGAVGFGSSCDYDREGSDCGCGSCLSSCPLVAAAHPARPSSWEALGCGCGCDCGCTSCSCTRSSATGCAMACVSPTQPRLFTT